MDIYKQAEEMDVDFMDKEGNIYKIQAYNKCKRDGIQTAGIAVYSQEGVFIGIAKRLN